LIKKITLYSEPFNNTNVCLKKINLFVGINGGGKSYFLKILSNPPRITSKDISKIPVSYSIHLIDDDKVITVRKEPNGVHFQSQDSKKLSSVYINESSPISINIQPDVKTSLNSPFSMLEFNEMIDEINPHLKKLFNREIITKYNGTNTKIAFYVKSSDDGKLEISPDDDGFGILNSVNLITFLLYTKCDLLCIEELTGFIHPSIIPDILRLIFKICLDKNIQLIFTSHNPVVISEYFKLFYHENENGDYSINKCSIDSKSKINIDEIHYGNFENSLSDFFLNFPTKEDVEIMKELSTKHQ